jgi:hypothetical protein
MNTVEIIRDDFQCSCGNNSHAQGAYPCDGEGVEVMPGDNFGGLWCCDRCGVIFRIPDADEGEAYTGAAAIVGKKTT